MWFPGPQRCYEHFFPTKRSFDKLLSYILNGWKTGPRLVRGSTKPPTQGFPLLLVSSFSPCIKFHLCASTGGHGWTSALKVQDKHLCSGLGQVSALDKITAS